MNNFIIELIIDILGYSYPYILKDSKGYKTTSGQYFMNQDWAKERYEMLNNLSNIADSEKVKDLQHRVDLYLTADSKFKEICEERQIQKRLLYEQLNSIYKEIYGKELDHYKE